MITATQLCSPFQIPSNRDITFERRTVLRFGIIQYNVYFISVKAYTFTIVSLIIDKTTTIGIDDINKSADP